MKNQHVHFIGVGGIGMSGLAKILLQKGGKVSGSDTVESEVTRQLVQEGAVIHIGHAEEHLVEASVVVYSTAVSQENPEYQQAIQKKIPIIHRSHFLHELMRNNLPLLVTGTHGKTTTSSLLAYVLVASGEDPSFAIGGIVQSLDANAAYGKGNWFVAEADESDGSFLAYDPFGAIVTNIDSDHLDYWKTEERLKQGFMAFESKVKNKDLLFWCADDPKLASLSYPGISYGFSASASLRIIHSCNLGWKSVFDIRWHGRDYKGIEIPLIGNHNILNASAVFGLCLQLGIDEQRIRDAMALFKGVGRRTEKKGEWQTILVYDDYAHHPTEIETTLQAFRNACQGKRLVVLFQPHRYSRTRDCFDAFGPALQAADLLVLTDIYAAGETPIEEVEAPRLHAKMKTQIQKEMCYIPKDQMVEEVAKMLLPGDIVVTMGAGDITKIGPQILHRLQQCH